MSGNREKNLWRSIQWGTALIALSPHAAVWGTPVTACPDATLGRVVYSDTGLEVTEPAVAALQANDVLVQLNGRQLRTCDDVRMALREARDRRLTPLLLVRRDGTNQAVVITLPEEVRAVTVATVVPPSPIPPSPIPTAVPTPISVSDADAVREMAGELVTFGRKLQADLPVPMAQPWSGRVEDLRRTYAARSAAVPAVRAVEPVLGYYETMVAILEYKERATRGRRAVRAQSEVVLEYDSDSPIAGWIERYPFLRPSVIAAPKTITFIGTGEVVGRWAPDRAVALLVERAITDGEVLSHGLSGERPNP